VPLRGFGALLKDHERGSRSCSVGHDLAGMFFGGWWPSSGSTPNDESITCPGSRFSERCVGFCSRSMDTVYRSDPRGDPGSRRDEFGRDRTARFDPRALLLLRTRHPVVVAALATEWVSTASSWLRRHQRTIGRIGGVFLIVIGFSSHGRVALVRPLVARQFPSGRAIM